MAIGYRWKNYIKVTMRLKDINDSKDIKYISGWKVQEDGYYFYMYNCRCCYSLDL